MVCPKIWVSFRPVLNLGSIINSRATRLVGAFAGVGRRIGPVWRVLLDFTPTPRIG